MNISDKLCSLSALKNSIGVFKVVDFNCVSGQTFYRQVDITFCRYHCNAVIISVVHFDILLVCTGTGVEQAKKCNSFIVL